MSVVGYIALILVAVFVLVSLAVLVRSIPDIRRYSRMRKM